MVNRQNNFNFDAILAKFRQMELAVAANKPVAVKPLTVAKTVASVLRTEDNNEIQFSSNYKKIMLTLELAEAEMMDRDPQFEVTTMQQFMLSLNRCFIDSISYSSAGTSTTKQL